MKPVVIIGAGGFAREVLDVIDAANQGEPQYEVLGYVVDPQYGSPGTMVNEKPILGGLDWLSKRARDIFAICGVGPSHHRYQLARRAEGLGCRFFSVVHPRAVLTRWIQLGRGVVITAGCVLTNQIRIGNHVQVNLACTIGHDAILEDFVTLAPGVHISGNATLRQGAFIGTGANLIEKLEIGAWSIVGAGSVVVQDVPANTTAVGVPAKVIKRREPGWHLS
jgi:sugar O-acyltransferase (sialic acid O-acetyltransferase NeuD family)